LARGAVPSHQLTSSIGGKSFTVVETFYVDLPGILPNLWEALDLIADVRLVEDRKLVRPGISGRADGVPDLTGVVPSDGIPDFTDGRGIGVIQGEHEPLGHPSYVLVFR
jgi:hypothetical protein